MTKILSCLQPTYLPWLPFFERMIISDIFVILDDVEFSKNSNHNRNYIKNKKGKLLLTVPVKYKNRVLIKDIQIDNSKNWRKKHWETINQSYGKLKEFKKIQPELIKIYEREWFFLAQLNVEIIRFFARYFKIKSKIYLSSDLDTEGKSNQKLINICKYFSADTFVVKENTEHYHPKEVFLNDKIKFKYFSNKTLNYKQLGNSFIPHLSALDYIANCGSFYKTIQKND